MKAIVFLSGLLLMSMNSFAQEEHHYDIVDSHSGISKTKLVPLSPQSSPKDKDAQRDQISKKVYVGDVIEDTLFAETTARNSALKACEANSSYDQNWLLTHFGEKSKCRVSHCESFKKVKKFTTALVKRLVRFGYYDNRGRWHPNKYKLVWIDDYPVYAKYIECQAILAVEPSKVVSKK